MMTKSMIRAMDIATSLDGADLQETLCSIAYILNFTIDSIPGNLNEKLEMLREWFELTIDTIRDGNNECYRGS